jgi:apolipoprotein N-acyltransferase
MVDSLPGKEKTVFRTDKARFGVLICWENMFPELFREMAAQGVDFMVGMTNEAFIGKSPVGHYQMFALYVLRAVENHVSLVRTSSTGVSAIVDPNGRITTRVRDPKGRDVDVEALAVGSVPLTAERTFYTRHGDWFVYLLFALLTGFVAAGILSGRREPAGSAGR